jgi:mediator of RNA polymerase II transcription subunit 18
MHELLLYGQVPAIRHTQLLHILAGIAATQPQPILETHLVFKPNRTPGSGTQKQVGGAQDIQKTTRATTDSQAQELYYMQLVADVYEDEGKTTVADDADEVGDMILNGDGGIELGVIEASGQVPLSTGYGIASTMQANEHSHADPPSSFPASQQWTLQFRDLPETSRHRAVTSRLITDTPITSGDPLRFMAALDYTYDIHPLPPFPRSPPHLPHTSPPTNIPHPPSHTKTYLLSGHRYTHNSTSLLLYRILLPPSSFPSTTLPHPTTTTTTSLQPKPRSPTLLDPSGTYILQASLRVHNTSKIETMTKAVNELLALKEMLKGCVELEVGERLALDTRVR